MTLELLGEKAEKDAESRPVSALPFNGLSLGSMGCQRPLSFVFRLGSGNPTFAIFGQKGKQPSQKKVGQSQR